MKSIFKLVAILYGMMGLTYFGMLYHVPFIVFPVVAVVVGLLGAIWIDGEGGKS